MKTILIATDFSAASRNASIYGMELAKSLNAKIVLFSAFKVPDSSLSVDTSRARYSILMQTDKHLLHDADFLDPEKRYIEIECEEGNAAEAVIKVAKQKKADFIIMGMKATDLKQRPGSTAIAVAADTDIPVIMVPENAVFSNPEVFVFIKENKASQDNIREELTSITHLFKSKLYVFTHHDDLLDMISHKHLWIDMMSMKDEINDLTFYSHVPLLFLSQEHVDCPEFGDKNLFAESRFYHGRPVTVPSFL